MGAHKLTAGNGYTYLTRQTAAQDAGPIPAGGLGAYYAERGEAPGQWLGSGLAGLGIAPGSLVSEAQMVSLFGEGRHPDAATITAELFAQGAALDVVDAATELGTPFALNPAANEYTRQVAQLMSEWNAAHGLSGCAPVPAWAKARIRTAVAGAMFARANGREPVDARELADFIATQSRLASRAVAGFDLTFSPVKSVSVLWALAPLSIAREIEAAHHAAVADTMRWLEREAAFTRLGRDGIRQVDVRGLVAAAFLHRASRAGDPDLHTHVAVSNKVQTLDGRWRALDGRVLLKATVAASERYNTRLEAEMRDRLGVRFADRAGTDPQRRSVREIVGVDRRLLDLWSSRRRAIDTRRGALTAEFQREHGRPPTPVEAIEIAQQATLQTRPGKREPDSEGEQRRQWRREAADVVGQATLGGLLDRALNAPTSASPDLDAERIGALAAAVIDRVQADRATWQRWHVSAEAQRAARRLDLPVRQLHGMVERIVAAALGDHSVALLRPDVIAEPEPLRRSDGSSVYRVAGSQLYTSPAVLAAEQSLLELAQRDDGHRATEASVELALLEATANGLALNAGQIALIRALASSGARCQLALAAAGTGKTTALRVLTRAWGEDGGAVIALAPSAAAARVLGDAVGVPGDTIAKFLHDLGTASEARVGPGTLVLIDEAGMAGTPDLARLAQHVTDRGGDVRLIGDDRQLAAIGAGGALRDLARTVGAITLEETVRFSDPAEAAATRLIRVGDPRALDFYLTGGRVQVGDEHTALQSAYSAWAADRARGRDALLLAATRDQISELNTRARADRLAAAGGRVGREVRLVDGTVASAGDVIVTRHNDRRIRITATDWVKNGDRFTICAVRERGDLEALHHHTGRVVVLPIGYVREHLTLGYASTIHAAQGSTADTCHTVLTGAESREQLYVALTRGRHANHLHLALPGAADEHAAIRRDTLLPPTAGDLLRRILDHETAPRSATTEQRDLLDPARRLRDAVARYRDAVETTTRRGGPTDRPPLPWLPGVFRGAGRDWQPYLHARAALVRNTATAVARDAIQRQVARQPQRTRALLQRDPDLIGELAVWTAVHGDLDRNPRLTEREQAYREHLQLRLHRSTNHLRQASRHIAGELEPGVGPSTHPPVSL